jgi:hypothetical protein
VVVPAEQRGWVESISWVRRLPDGRVGAYVVTVDPVNHPHRRAAVVILAPVGDRWLIDEVHLDPNLSLGAEPTPLAPTPVASPVTAGDFSVRLVETPEDASVDEVIVEITDLHGKPVDGVKVQFTIESMDMDMGKQTVVAEPLGEGRYGATVSLGMAGDWRITVTVRGEGSGPVTVALPLAIE